jgi:hypothetical protein
VERLSSTVRVELGRFGAAGDLAGVVERWPDAVGAGIAANAWPARTARDGTLIVHTADSIWAFELTHRGAEIAARLCVPAVKFVPGPLAGEALPTPTPRPVEPSADDRRAAHELAAQIDDENLRKTVEKAIALGLSSSRDRRPL